jgi:ABC-type transport system involved in multi-copper enzyme maturation permease subunit
VTAVTRAELAKLATVRLPLGLLGIAALLTAAMSLLTALQAGSTAAMADASLSTAAGLAGVLSTTYFAMIMAMVLGITISTGEFRHATATATYLAAPRRERVLAAKAIAAFGAGLLFGLAGAAVTTAAGLGAAAARGYPVALGAGTIARYGAGAVLGAGLLASLGAGLGMLVRSQLGAIITVFVWAFAAENTIGGLSHPIAPYLPFMAATSLAGSPPPDGHPLPFLAAALLVAGITAVTCVIAARTSLRADIT